MVALLSLTEVFTHLMKSLNAQTVVLSWISWIWGCLKFVNCIMYNCTLVNFFVLCNWNCYQSVINLEHYIMYICTLICQSVIRGAKILKIYCNAARPFLQMYITIYVSNCNSCKLMQHAWPISHSFLKKNFAY